MLGPVLERIARDYEGKLVLVKASTDDNSINAEKFGVRSIPSVKLFKNGEVIDEFVGVQPEEMIRRWLGQKL